MVETEPKSKYYQEQGNGCVKNGDYMEAVVNYSFAIKHDLLSAENYSNRSLAFLKLEQYYFALDDAESAIRLLPKWPKGYYRKAEVLFAAQRYKEAINFYQKTLKMQPGDLSLIGSISKAQKAQLAADLLESQIPWLGSAIGLVIGILGVLLEYCAMNNRYLQHPFLQLLVIVLLAVAGYGLAFLYRKYMKLLQSKSLDKPVDITEGKFK